MTLINATDPSPEQIKAFLAHKRADEPVYMLNLLKFKDKATYKDGEDISGRAAYERYAKGFAALNQGVIQTVFGGNVNGLLIGQAIDQGDTAWDAVAIVKYSNAQTMFDAVSSEAYRQLHKHRRAGLAGQLLIFCDGDEVF